MWEHYRKTFAGMQITMAVIAAAVYVFFGHVIAMAVVFYVFMQISAVIGALWANRLSVMVRRRQTGLPLKPPT